MSKKKSPTPAGKRRTRAHILEEMSLNFLERKVLLRNHQLLRMPLREYGRDAAMLHFDDRGQIESGEVHFQVKATDQPSFTTTDQIRCRVETAHVSYWSNDPQPFILILYDAGKHRAFWLHIQNHVDQHPAVLDNDKATTTFLIPLANKLTLHVIDRFRRLSLKSHAHYLEGLS